MKIIFGIFVFSLLLPVVGQAGCVHAVGVLTDTPYYATKPRNYATGLVRDFLEKIESKSNCKFEETPINYVRALQELRSSRLGLFAFTARISTWLEVADFKVIYSSTRFLVVRKDAFKKDHALNDYLQNSKFKYGNLIGTVMFFMPEEIDKLVKENRVVQSSTAMGVVQLAESGKVQAFFVTPVYLRYLQKDLAFKDKFEVIPDAANRIDIGLYISKKRVLAKESEELKKAIDGLREDGTVMNILKKYVSADDIKDYR